MNSLFFKTNNFRKLCDRHVILNNRGTKLKISFRLELHFFFPMHFVYFAIESQLSKLHIFFIQFS